MGLAWSAMLMNRDYSTKGDVIHVLPHLSRLELCFPQTTAAPNQAVSAAIMVAQSALREAELQDHVRCRHAAARLPSLNTSSHTAHVELPPPSSFAPGYFACVASQTATARRIVVMHGHAAMRVLTVAGADGRPLSERRGGARHTEASMHIHRLLLWCE